MTDETDELLGQPLTPKEKETCFHMIEAIAADVDPYKAAAEKMGNLAPVTIHKHLEAAKRKTGRKNTFSMLFWMQRTQALSMGPATAGGLLALDLEPLEKKGPPDLSIVDNE